MRAVWWSGLVSVGLGLSVVAAPVWVDRAAAGPVVCVGDCNGDGSVLVNELVAAVNIALGVAPVGTCSGADANGDGQVMIAELVDAVSDALFGCGVTPPTPPPTRTPTATTRPSDTPTPSPSPGVDVSGRWRSDQVEIQSSSCPAQVTQLVRNEIRAGNFNCQFDIDQQGATATVVEMCPGDDAVTFGASVDPQGNFSYVTVDEDEEDGCFYTVTTRLTADLSQSPSTGSATFDYAFEPSCEIDDCRIVIRGRFTRVAP